MGSTSEVLCQINMFAKVGHSPDSAHPKLCRNACTPDRPVRVSIIILNSALLSTRICAIRVRVTQIHIIHIWPIPQFTLSLLNTISALIFASAPRCPSSQIFPTGSSSLFRQSPYSIGMSEQYQPTDLDEPMSHRKFLYFLD